MRRPCRHFHLNGNIASDFFGPTRHGQPILRQLYSFSQIQSSSIQLESLRAGHDFPLRCMQGLRVAKNSLQLRRQACQVGEIQVANGCPGSDTPHVGRGQLALPHPHAARRGRQADPTVVHLHESFDRVGEVERRCRAPSDQLAMLQWQRVCRRAAATPHRKGCPS